MKRPLDLDPNDACDQSLIEVLKERDACLVLMRDELRRMAWPIFNLCIAFAMFLFNVVVAFAATRIYEAGLRDFAYFMAALNTTGALYGARVLYRWISGLTRRWLRFSANDTRLHLLLIRRAEIKRKGQWP